MKETKKKEGSKILYVITKANWGGAQKYVFDLSAAAKRRGYDVIVAHGSSGVLEKYLQREGIRTIEVRMRNEASLGALVEAFRELRALMRIEQPSIAHLNSSMAGAAGALAARLARVPKIIFTAHGWAYNEARPVWQRILIAAVQYSCVLFSHKTICVSKAVRRGAAWMLFVQHKFIVIHNGILPPAFITREDARAFLKKDAAIPQNIWIGAIAELHPNKRLDLAIEAFSKIAPQFPDTALVLIGEGEERVRLTQLIKGKNLASRIHLLGMIPDAARYLKAFDIFILPSHTEALGLSVIEAGFAGLPVIASNVGGIPEIIDNGTSGMLCERGNAGQFAAALKKLLDSPAERERLEVALKKKVEREFSLEQMVEKTMALYQG